MLPLIAGAVPAASAVAAGASLFGGMQSNASSAHQARQMMEFQRQMSNTQWQRGVADMKAAGINPMLSFMEGGASAPQGAMASQSDVVTPAVNSALMRDRFQLDNDVAESTITANNASAAKQQADANVSNETARLVKAQTAGRQYENVSAKAVADFYSKIGDDSSSILKGAKEYAPLLQMIFGGKR
jgi:hypothetical protein